MKTLKTISIVIATCMFQITASKAQMSQYKFEQLFNEAFSNILETNYEEAIPMLEKLHEADPDHAQVGYFLGMCQVKSQDVTESTVEILRKASAKYDYFQQIGRVEDRTSPANVWFYLAKVYSQQHRFDEAIVAYRTYMSCIPMASIEKKRNVIDAIAEARKQKARWESGSNSLLASQRP